MSLFKKKKILFREGISNGVTAVGIYSTTHVYTFSDKGR